MYWGWIEHREPFYTYFYFFAWAPFLWVIDRTLAIRTGSSPLDHPKNFLWLLFVSTTVWLIFEVINFRLKNWAYIGVPPERWIRWPGYALSFATVMPGILMLRRLIESYLPDKEPPDPAITRSIYTGWALPLGFGMFILPLLSPNLFFPLVWGSFFFMFEPWIQRAGGHSLIRDWMAGSWRRTWTLLLAGLLCGLFWEGCNYGAGSKWIYWLPYWNFGKVFEMPILGFIGFMPFALEVHAFHQVAIILWNRKNSTQRLLITVGILVFWLLAFWGIDRWTVAGWR
jgi:hypothetical protein